MPIRILKAPEEHWGDYGQILRHGMTSHLGRAADGCAQLERTAPYIPPISFPGFDLVVTNDFRTKLEQSGLQGLGFEPVHKARIVDLPWHTWAPDTEDPARFPKSGEPEDYILERPHSAKLADQMGALWRLVLPRVASVEREPTDDRWVDRIYLVTSTCDGADVFQANGVGYFFVSEAAQAWLVSEAGQHVAFRDCLLR